MIFFYNAAIRAHLLVYETDPADVVPCSLAYAKLQNQEISLFFSNSSHEPTTNLWRNVRACKTTCIDSKGYPTLCSSSLSPSPVSQGSLGQQNLQAMPEYLSRSRTLSHSDQHPGIGNFFSWDPFAAKSTTNDPPAHGVGRKQDLIRC